MSTPAAPETALPPRRVYCQNREVAAELSRLGPEFDLLDLPDPFPGNERTASVVIGDHPSVFTPALQSAIGKNRVRLLYVLGEDHSMPAEAEGIPVFGFLPALSTEPCWPARSQRLSIICGWRPGKPLCGMNSTGRAPKLTS